MVPSGTLIIESSEFVELQFSFSGMLRIVGALLSVILLLPHGRGSYGQIQDTWIPSTFEPGSNINLFTQWKNVPSGDGFLVFLPSDWELITAKAVRQAFRYVSLDVEYLSEGKVLLSSSDALRGTYDLIIQVNTDFPNLNEPLEVSVAPAIKVGPSYIQHEGYRRYAQLQPHENSVDGTTLAFDGRMPHLHIPSQWIAPLSDSHTFEWWIQTTTINTVVLSTWDGLNASPYPMEFVIDARGRMRYYRNSTGHHVTLVTKSPVADGGWHHIAVVNDAEANWTKLYLDGLIADSLFDPTSTQFDELRSLTLGGRADFESSSLSQRFSGKLDNIRLWNSSRSRTQIQAAMRQSVQSAEILELDFESTDGVRYFREQNISEYYVSGGPIMEPLDYNFRGIVFDEGVMLSWRYSIPITSSFLVERSEDGKIFEELARVEESFDTHQWSYTDFTPPNQVVFYRLLQNPSGKESQLLGTIKLGLGTEAEPPAFEILGSYPNPFNPQTVISYEVRLPQHLMLSIINISGLEVEVLSDRYHESGVFEALWDGTELPSGTYFIRLQGRNGNLQTRQILLAK